MELLSQKGVAEKTGLSVSTVQTYRKRGTLPSPDAVLDNKPLWTAATIDIWMTKRAGVVSDAEYTKEDA